MQADDTGSTRRIDHPEVGLVETRLSGGASVTFVLDREFDPEEGRVDLTDMLAELLVLGLKHPYSEPEGAVPFGTVETEGAVEAACDGRTLVEKEMLETVGAGFVRAITESLDLIVE